MVLPHKARSESFLINCIKSFLDLSSIERGSLNLTCRSGSRHMQAFRRIDAWGAMWRRFLLVVTALLCGALASCAPMMAVHDSEVEYKTVNTSAGPLRLAVVDRGKGR